MSVLPYALVAVGTIAAAILGPRPRETTLRGITALTVGAVCLLALGVLALVALIAQVDVGYRAFLFVYPLVVLLFVVAALVPFVAIHWWRRVRHGSPL